MDARDSSEIFSVFPEPEFYLSKLKARRQHADQDVIVLLDYFLPLTSP
jgi:hypothetical protein